MSFAASQALALPLVRRADVMVVVSPCFPALLPTMLHNRMRGIPWILWVQDILPDGAAATGLLSDGLAIKAARRIERLAYANASAVVVISETFEENLRAKGVGADKLHWIYNPATRATLPLQRPATTRPGLRLLAMGNVGRSQGLDRVVRLFEEIDDPDAKLVITGVGVAVAEVRAEIRTNRVQMLGMVDDARLEHELSIATAGVVSQRSDLLEFNVPSKLMNYMMRGLPVISVARREAEVSRIVRAADAGWVVSDLAGLKAALGALRDDGRRRQAGAAAARFARNRFSSERCAQDFERVLLASLRQWPREPANAA
jgi:colanic acid biosynthesis glycosyl transferase WcaI